MSVPGPPASCPHHAPPIDTDANCPSPALDGAQGRSLQLLTSRSAVQATRLKWLSSASEIDSGVMSQLSRS